VGRASLEPTTIDVNLPGEDKATMRTAQRYRFYDPLMALPETLTGEILSDRLHARSRDLPQRTPSP